MGQGAQCRDRPGVRRHAGVRGHAPAHPRGAGLGRKDPVRDQDRRVLLQLLEGQGASARPLAPHDTGRVSQRAAGLGNRDRCRRPGPGRGQTLGVPWRAVPETGLPALPGFAVPRRRRCRCRARVRPRRQGLRAGWLRVTGSEVANRLDRPRPRLRRHRLRPRLDDQVELPAHRQALDARHPAGRCQAGPRGHGRGSRDQRLARPDRGLRARLRHAHDRLLQQRNLCAQPGRQADEDRRAARRDHRRASRMAADPAAHGVDRGGQELSVGHPAGRTVRRFHGRPARPGRVVHAERDHFAVRLFMDAPPPDPQRAGQRRQPARGVDPAGGRLAARQARRRPGIFDDRCGRHRCRR